ncbi:hypothetical protein A2U01_0117205, partial [Trifolium medium]|nr:hypothetical protein [Trifolium medium]
LPHFPTVPAAHYYHQNQPYLIGGTI